MEQRQADYQRRAVRRPTPPHQRENHGRGKTGAQIAGQNLSPSQASRRRGATENPAAEKRAEKNRGGEKNKKGSRRRKIEEAVPPLRARARAHQTVEEQ
jgi:hypothetical protein